MSATAVPAAGTSAAEPAPSTRQRLDSVDLLRGIVMVIMALDHVRDFYSAALFQFDPTDLTRTTPAFFFTRWITHFCAPVFVFLAGTGAYLSLANGKPARDVSRFLWTRGLWLVFIELTVVRLGWVFNLDYVSFLAVQVIWVIGWSMVVLAALVRVPIRVVGAAGVIMIAGHNLLDGIHAPLLIDPQTGAYTNAPISAWIWSVLHQQNWPVLYPLIPWIGVMMAGYAFGSLLRRPADERRRLLTRLGLTLTALFVVIRALNVYGDPSRWSSQATPLFTVLSFLNTTKYPPSLLYLLMTLGPAIALLPLLEKWKGPTARFFLVFGRVPFFYYVVHIFVIHAGAVLAGVLTHHDASAFFTIMLRFPKDYGFSLPVVYAIWIAVVLGLYPLCRWFAGVKARRRDWWLGYL